MPKKKWKWPITPSTEITAVNISFGRSYIVYKNGIIGVQISSYFVSVYHVIKYT